MHVQKVVHSTWITRQQLQVQKIHLAYFVLLFLSDILYFTLKSIRCGQFPHAFSPTFLLSGSATKDLFFGLPVQAFFGHWFAPLISLTGEITECWELSFYFGELSFSVFELSFPWGCPKFADLVYYYYTGCPWYTQTCFFLEVIGWKLSFEEILSWTTRGKKMNIWV